MLEVPVGFDPTMLNIKERADRVPFFAGGWIQIADVKQSGINTQVPGRAGKHTMKRLSYWRRKNAERVQINVLLPRIGVVGEMSTHYQSFVDGSPFFIFSVAVPATLKAL